MANQSVAIARAMAAAPPELRTRIVAGMRWTVWLSALALPFSLGTNAILARTGPEAIGTFGLLAVYIGLVAAFFYLGGDSVIIKFLPELPLEKRLPFLVSYFCVVCMSLSIWLALVLEWPDKLHYLFGDKGGQSFYLLALCLSPIYIVFSMVGAALKALLEIRWAQILMRAINIGSCCFYAVLFLLARRSLAAHYRAWIWGIYLGLTTILSGVGAYRLISVSTSHLNERKFFLPRGFWKYVLATQQLSAIGFFVGRLDYILVLNFGNLETLGKYVAVSTITLLIPLVNTFFLDSLLPSLTNLLAMRNFSAASEVFGVYMRISFLVNTATTCGLLLLTDLFLKMFGPKYSGLDVAVIAAVLLIGLGNPGAVGSTLLSSVGKQQRAVFVTVGQFALYCGLFYLLWPHWHLLGAVIAFGSATCLSYLGLLAVAERSVPMRISVAKDYMAFALVAISTAAAALVFKRSSSVLMMPLWVAAETLFIVLARYRAREFRAFAHCLLPGYSTRERKAI